MDGLFNGLFGNLISAGANLIAGQQNREAASALNNQNIQEQEKFATTGLQWRAKDARNAEANTGINALTLLGAPTSSFSNLVGDGSLGPTTAAAGQDLGRAANALTDRPTKAAQLEEKLLEAKIANVNADTVHQQAVTSELSRRHGQPGAVSVDVPLPVPAPHTRGTLPLFQDFRGRTGERVTLPSKEASEAMQNLPSSVVGTLPVGVGLIQQNLKNAGEALTPVGGSEFRSLHPQSSDYYYTPF